MAARPYLSIVIPVFNESRKIARDIQAAGEFLTSAGLSGEIIDAVRLTPCHCFFQLI